MAVLVNAEKKPLFTADERVAIVREVFREYSNVEVDTFDGLLVEYAESTARQRDHPRAARRFGFRVRVSDGAHEPAPRAEALKRCS